MYLTALHKAKAYKVYWTTICYIVVWGIQTKDLAFLYFLSFKLPEFVTLPPLISPPPRDCLSHCKPTIIVMCRAAITTKKPTKVFHFNNQNKSFSYCFQIYIDSINTCTWFRYPWWRKWLMLLMRLFKPIRETPIQKTVRQTPMWPPSVVRMVMKLNSCLPKR